MGFTNPRLEEHSRQVKEHASSGRNTHIAWLKCIKSGVRCSFLKVWVNIEFSGKHVKTTERAGDKMKCFEAQMRHLGIIENRVVALLRCLVKLKGFFFLV